MEVVILKMLSGEEVIARKVIEKTGYGDETRYEKARVVQVIPDQQGRPQATLAPYVTLAPDAVLDINPMLVITEIPCPASVEKSYTAAVSPILQVGG